MLTSAMLADRAPETDSSEANTTYALQVVRSGSTRPCRTFALRSPLALMSKGRDLRRTDWTFPYL